MLAEAEVAYMSRVSTVKLTRMDAKGNTRKDQTSKPFLTWLVKMGMMRDVIEFLILYGIDPKPEESQTVRAKCDQFLRLYETMKEKPGSKTSDEVEKLMMDIQSCVVVPDHYAKPKSKKEKKKTDN